MVWLLLPRGKRTRPQCKRQEWTDSRHVSPVSPNDSLTPFSLANTPPCFSYFLSLSAQLFWYHASLIAVLVALMQSWLLNCTNIEERVCGRMFLVYKWTLRVLVPKRWRFMGRLGSVSWNLAFLCMYFLFSNSHLDCDKNSRVVRSILFTDTLNCDTL